MGNFVFRGKLNQVLFSSELNSVVCIQLLSVFLTLKRVEKNYKIQLQIVGILKSSFQKTPKPYSLLQTSDNAMNAGLSNRF